MKYLFLILLFAGCAFRRDGLPSDVTLKIKINGVAYEKDFDLDYKEGIAILNSEDIEAGLGLEWKSDRRTVQIEIPENEKLISFSSFKKNEARTITTYVVGFADKSRWKKTSFQFVGADFALVTKYESKINHNDFKSYMFKIWNAYLNRVGYSTDVITFVELDSAPLSGGPLAENVFALFYQDKISSEDKASIQRELGWTPKNSTMDYVTTYYGADGWKNYLIGTLAHEVSHTYFGFGVTRERFKYPHEVWFSLGLGMVYDMEITTSITGKSPQIFMDSERVWKSYSTNAEIDQRLINPDTKNDKKFGLDRKKVYAHSKAHSFLKNLRLKVGPRAFDRAVKRYLQECGHCINGYQDFKRFLPGSRYEIQKVEKAFNI